MGPRVLQEIGVSAPISAHLRLGEGTGAIAAWPLLRVAAALPKIRGRSEVMEDLARFDPGYVEAMRAAGERGSGEGERGGERARL